MKKTLLSSFIFLSISLFAQFTLPAPRDTSNFGKYLQRTMKLLATSTPSKKNTVKIMVYGQSIAKQEWSDSVRKYLKIRYPNANIIMINRAIGGCWSGCLQNPMAYDIKTFYPDLILFDVYGWNAWGGDQGPEYENILNYIRTNTVAEIAMQNHHVGTGDKNSGNVNSGGPRYFSELATKYGIELIDMRTPWFKYLQDNSLLETDLAPDGVHLNNRGWFLMSKLYMPYLNYRPNKWITADTFGLMKSYVVGKDIFAINGKITLPFNGNKIDIVHESPVANMDSASVLIDSKRPSSIAGTVMFTRPNDTYDTLFRHNSYDWPWQKGAIMKFNPNTSPLLRAQDWTLRFLTYNAGSNFTYSVTGTRTGGDGTASVNITSGLATSGSTFTSNSGQVVIDPAQFWFGNGPYSALPLAAGFTITWQAKAFYTDTFIPSTAPGTAIEVVSTLAQGISNANHILELDAKGAKNTPIKEIRVYQPFYSRVATSSTLIPPVLSVTSPITICSGLTANLTTAFVDTKNLVGTVTYWQNAAATISITAPNMVSVAGTYYIRKQVTTSGVGFMDIKPIDVIIKNSPVLTLTGNTNSCDNSIASLTVSGAIAYLWRPTNSTQPILTTSITGVYTVIGTNPNQCSASIITTITSVNCPPYPTLSVTGPISICSGLTADLTTSFVDTKNLVGTVTYWQNAGATISVTAPNLVSVAGTYYIRKQVTTNTGVGFVDIKPIQVLVFATPVLTLTGNTNSCENNIASLTVSGANSYLWRPTNSTQPILTTSITGIYTIIGTNPNQCSASIITTITSVNCPPYPTLSVTGPISICSGLTADLTTSFVDTKNLVGTVTYWQNAGATISVTAPNMVSVAGTYYIRKQVTTNTGVGFVDIKPIQVLVFATPVLTVAGNTNSCDNNIASLTVSGASSYLWRPTNSTQPILTTSITGIYTIIGTNPNQCSASIITTITSVNCPPYPTLSVTGPISICSGLTADLTTSFVDTKNLVGTVTYWQNAGATISVTAPNMVSVAGIYYIRKQVTTNTGVGFVDIKPIQVLVFATPVLTVTGNTNSCENSIASLTVSGANSYLWRPTNSTQSILTTSITGVYTVIGTNPNQCSASIITTITSVNCPPYPTLSVTGPISICSGLTADLTTSFVDTKNLVGTVTYWQNAGATISVTAPNMVSVAGIYYIRKQVTTNTGVGFVDIKPIQVLVFATPVLTLTGNTNSCENSIASLTVSGASSYLWRPTNSTQPILTTSITGIYTIIGTNPNQCSASIITTITSVNCPPYPTLSVTGPISICSGLTADLTTSFVDTKNLVGTVTYWQNAGATISVTAPNMVSVAGIYYIRKQVTTNTGVGFVDIKPIQVLVFATPVLTVAGNTNSCDNNIASLTVSGANSYLWRPTNSTQPILTTSITGVYTVIGTNPNQCSASMITTITSVNCPPYPTLSVTGPISICSGLTADLTTSFVDTKNLVGTVTYWQNAGATISVTAPNMVSVAGTYYIRKQVTTNTGVGFVDIKPIQVLVFATPVLTVAGNTNSCENSIASLTVSGANSYLWRPTNSTQPILTTSITGVYTIIGTNTNQCSASIITTITSVNCPPYPTLSVTSPISICSGLTADLTTSFVDTKNLVGMVTYWQNAGATISVTAPNMVSVAGTYYIRKQVTTNTGVGFVDIKPIQVLVFATPVLTVTGNTNSCENSIASLTVSGANSYLWRPTNSTQSILTTSITGVYTVIGTNPNQCSANIITTITSVNCITQSIFKNNEDDISINPNPANDKITVSTKNYTILNIRLINSLGNKVLETADNQIDVSNLPNGLYIIQIESVGNKTYKKLIISH